MQKAPIAAAMLALLLGGGNAVARDDSALATSRIALKGLAAPAEILVDPWGIAHIEAASQADAFFVQGFNAARDRLWQIDLWRKRGLGELAKDFGPGYLEQDKASRLFLYRGDMFAEWNAYGSDAKRITERFTDGINTFVQLTRDDPALLPEEFRLLGYRPSFWQAADVVRIRSHGLTRNVTSEVPRARIACAAGPEADLLRRSLEPAWQARVPAGLDPCAIPADLLRVFDLATAGVTFTPERLRASLDDATQFAMAPPPASDPGHIGSNNWAIHGSRTDTGRPILANDPHRSHGVPSLRYAVHLRAPGLDVIGAGEPSLPGISIGHNGRIAFGLTIFAVDQEDLYVYETNPAAPQEYRYQDRWEPMRVVRETIEVKGQAPQTVELRFTRHGPVIHEQADRNRAFALRSVWFEPGTSAYLGSIDYMKARDWEEFRAAMNRWGAPSENQVFADSTGTIAWIAGGLTPIQDGWDGLLPVPGDGRYEWRGFRTMDELPSSVNPAEGFVATANEMNLPDGYPFAEKQLGFEWSERSRITRIREVLSGNRPQTLRSSMELQTDATSIPARRVRAVLASVPQGEPRLGEALGLLRDWDGRLESDSAAAALFEVWMTRHLRPGMVARLAPSDDVRRLVALGDLETLLGLLERPDGRWGADPTAARNDVLGTTLVAALADVEQRLGPNRATWSWGRLHQAMFEHPLGSVLEPWQRERMNVGPLPKAGSGSTPLAAGYRTSDFRVTSGASWRMVIDVGNWDNSWWVNSPGQSGDPRSPHYRDLVLHWAAEQYVPLVYAPERVRALARTRIQLTPAN